MKVLFEILIAILGIALGLMTVYFIRNGLCEYENMRFSIIIGQCI